MTRRNVVQRVAPRVAAASSYRASDARNAPSTLITMKGSATNVCATTTAGVVNGRVMPNQASRYLPTTPLRPNASSSATPPTTGGSTSGSVTSARTRPRPRNVVRASTQASGTPSTRQQTVVIDVVSRLSRSDVRASGDERTRRATPTAP